MTKLNPETRLLHPAAETPDTEPDNPLFTLGRPAPPVLYPYFWIPTETNKPESLQYRYIAERYRQTPKLGPNEPFDHNQLHPGLLTLGNEMRGRYEWLRERGFPTTSWLHCPGGVDNDRYYDFDQFMELPYGEMAYYRNSFSKVLRPVVKEADIKPVAYIGGPANDIDVTTQLLRPEEGMFPLADALRPIQDFQWAMDHMGKGWDSIPGMEPDPLMRQLLHYTLNVTRSPLIVEGRTLFRNSVVLAGYSRGFCVPCLMARDLSDSEFDPHPDEAGPDILKALVETIQQVDENPMDPRATKSVGLRELALLLRARGKTHRPVVLVTNAPRPVKEAGDEAVVAWRRDMTKRLLPWCDVVVPVKAIEDMTREELLT